MALPLLGYYIKICIHLNTSKISGGSINENKQHTHINSTLVAHSESSITKGLNRNPLDFLFIIPATIELTYSQK